MDTVRLVIEVDVAGYVRAGIADFQSQPHLFLSECLDWDDERRSRRLGETFFLIPVPGDAAEALLREDAELNQPGEGPAWEQKQAWRWARWVAFKQSWVRPAEWAWRARGNFQAVQCSRDRSVSFRWVLLPGGRVSGDALRSRLAHLDEWERVRSGDEREEGVDEELPF